MVTYDNNIGIAFMYEASSFRLSITMVHLRYVQLTRALLSFSLECVGVCDQREDARSQVVRLGKFSMDAMQR